MLLHLPWWAAVAVSSAVWVAWSALVGWWQARLPADRLRHEGPVLRLRRWETAARYERLFRVRRWKDRLPEAGTWFGGASKRHLPRGQRAMALDTFAVECRRAERTHWAILAATPWFAVWNPPALFVAMVVFALVANGPCLVAIRTNRLRVAEIQARRARRPSPGRPR